MNYPPLALSIVWADFRANHYANLDEERKAAYELDYEDGLLPPLSLADDSTL